jgi:hypothetical protein
MKKVGSVLLAVTALTVILVSSAVPASAARSASATLTEAGACSFQGTFTWSGWGGAPSITAELRLYYHFGSANYVVATYSAGSVSGRSGSVIHTFNLTSGGTSRQYFLNGVLFRHGSPIVQQGTSVLERSCDYD